MLEYIDDDGLEVHDTQEEALKRMKQIAAWKGKSLETFIQRDLAPNWLARLVRNTRFDWTAYKRLEERA